MQIFNGVILVQGIPFAMFSSFVCIFIGLLIGRIKIKGVSLGHSGVFIIALLYGALFADHISITISQKYNGEKIDISANVLKVIENMGLILFIGSVGFISGPKFFTNLKKNFKSYLIEGLLIILTATLTCVACFYIGKSSAKDVDEFNAMMVGIFSGALTSTPAFSAAKATADTKYESAVTVGHGIAYLFGVIGVVLYVQFVPKIIGANMEVERYIIEDQIVKRVGTERTDAESLHRSGGDIHNDVHIKNDINEKDKKNKKDELNIKGSVEKIIEYDPKRVPTERIDSTSRQNKLFIEVSSNENINKKNIENENEQEHKNVQDHENEEHEQEQEHETDKGTENDKDNDKGQDTEEHETENDTENVKDKAWLVLDKDGLCVFSFGSLAGIFIGAIRIPLSKKLLDGTTFSFTTTGGVLITTLVLGHYGRICCLSLKIKQNILELFRDLGLIFFLLGTGISGGAKFIDYFKPIYFLYGIAMTIIPLLIGFIFGKYVLKLSLLNNLGSLCGGMTSTPALGTLIDVSGTNAIGTSYAATYPIALISVVLSSQFMVILMK